MLFSNEEYLDMLLIYGKADCNSRRAQRLYRDKFPNRRVPNPRSFVAVAQRVRDTGSVVPQIQNRGPQRSNEVLEAEDAILQIVDVNPSVSTREIARAVGVSQFTVHRTLREMQLRPYHIQRVQCLTINDYQPRLVFCQWLIQQCTLNPQFSSNILATDEACFRRSGILNYHNSHTWDVENPHTVRQDHIQQQFCLNIWAGIIGNKLIGPFILPARLTGIRYRHFLENTLPNLLDDVPLETRLNMWFLHDGAPPHISVEVRRHLNQTFPDRWIGRYAPVQWPARSPDLNPLDFYLWGHLKAKVYQEEIRDIEHLRARVFEAAEEIRMNEDMLATVRVNWLRRCEACICANGGHFEHLCKTRQ